MPIEFELLEYGGPLWNYLYDLCPAIEEDSFNKVKDANMDEAVEGAIKSISQFADHSLDWGGTHDQHFEEGTAAMERWVSMGVKKVYKINHGVCSYSFYFPGDTEQEAIDVIEMSRVLKDRL